MLLRLIENDHTYLLVNPVVTDNKKPISTDGIS